MEETGKRKKGMQDHGQQTHSSILSSMIPYPAPLQGSENLNQIYTIHFTLANALNQKEDDRSQKGQKVYQLLMNIFMARGSKF